MWAGVKALGLPVVEAVARRRESIACFLYTPAEQIISTYKQNRLGRPLREAAGAVKMIAWIH